jgi:hypothetical protein
MQRNGQHHIMIVACCKRVLSLLSDAGARWAGGSCQRGPRRLQSAHHSRVHIALMNPGLAQQAYKLPRSCDDLLTMTVRTIP